jgi:hypothetical protein
VFFADVAARHDSFYAKALRGCTTFPSGVGTRPTIDHYQQPKTLLVENPW